MTSDSRKNITRTNVIYSWNLWNMEPKRWKIIITSSLICMYSVMRANGVQENRSRRCPNPLINVYTHRRICCRSSRPLPPPSPLGFRDFGNSHSPDVFCNMRMVILQMITSDCLFSIWAHMGLRKNRASGLQLEESCVCNEDRVMQWEANRLLERAKIPGVCTQVQFHNARA